MNINGSIFLIGENHIDVLKQQLSITPPPDGQLKPGTMICLDMDETDNMLEYWFPNHCQKATVLCPPPEAMYREIDGDQEGFILAYNNYLDHDSSVQDIMTSILLFLHIGGTILLYSPVNIEDGPVWLNTLLMFFYTRFGIIVGTSESNPAGYDSNYDQAVATFMYLKGAIDVDKFIHMVPFVMSNPGIVNKILTDLAPYCGNTNPMDFYQKLVQQHQQYHLSKKSTSC